MYRRKRTVTTVDQITTLVDFLERHPDLARGKLNPRSRTTEAREQSNKLWMHVAKKLNAVGYKRTPKEWQKFFNDYKCRILRRAEKLQASEGSLSGFTPLELRLVNVIGTERPWRRARANSDEPLQALLDDSSVQYDPEQDEEAMDSKTNIVQARSLSPPSEPDWLEEAPRQESAGRQAATDMEERATRAIESQATSMERMAAALERLADVATAAVDRFTNNNNGQFI